MEGFAAIAIFLFVLFLLLGTGVWVGLALLGVAWVGMELFTLRPVGDAMMTTIWRSASSWTLTALPLFIWMGEILFRTRLSGDMFKGLSPWMAGLPGGLLHTNVVGCTVFAAVSGSSEYAGYLMAAASFLAFAHTLNRGAHIRVNLLLMALGERRFWGELWSLVVGTAASSYLAWYAVKTVYWSWKLHDISQGQDVTPLWIPQLPMAFGAVLLAVCFADNLITLIATRQDNIQSDVVERAAE